MAVEQIIRIIETAWQGEEPTKPETTLLAPALVIRQSSLLPRELGEKEVSLKGD